MKQQRYKYVLGSIAVLSLLVLFSSLTPRASASIGAMGTSFDVLADATPPTLTHPDDVTYEEGTTGHNITWIPTQGSGNPLGYTVTIDGVLYQYGFWSSGTPITQNIDGLSVSNHTCRCTITDDAEQIVIDDAIVTVQSPGGGNEGPDQTAGIVLAIALSGAAIFAVGLAVILIRRRKLL